MINFENIRRHSQQKAIELHIDTEKNLPFIDDVKIRKDKDVLNRINILHIFYTISLEGEDSISFFKEIIDQNQWGKYLTEREKKVLHRVKLTQKEQIDFSWYKESIFILLWSIGLVEENMPYTQIDEIDISDYYDIIPPEKPYGLFLNNKLKDVAEILKMTDFYYYIHSALRGRKKNIFRKIFFDEKYNVSVVIERRKALEWLIDYNIEWDDVSLDT